MEHLPEGLDRHRHVDLKSRNGEPWARRFAIALFAVVAVAALLGAFGQQHSTVAADVQAATLTVQAPERVRGGLFFQGRLDIVARESIRRPMLILGEGWTEEMQLNTLEPAPASESSDDGQLELEYDPLRAGDHLTIWMQFEVNPLGAGRAVLETNGRVSFIPEETGGG